MTPSREMHIVNSECCHRHVGAVVRVHDTVSSDGTPWGAAKSVEAVTYDYAASRGLLDRTLARELLYHFT